MIRFLADADLNEGIISGCLRRAPTMDFLSANDADLQGVPDREVLRIAAEQDRILVSHDFRTMSQHFTLVIFSRREVPARASFW